jgi:hypothetical protein
MKKSNRPNFMTSGLDDDDAPFVYYLHPSGRLGVLQVPPLPVASALESYEPIFERLVRGFHMTEGFIARLAK